MFHSAYPFSTLSDDASANRCAVARWTAELLAAARLSSPMRLVCLSAFRCASARTMFADDRRYVETMRRKAWRAHVESDPNGSWTQELRKLRQARHRDAAIVRLHSVSEQEGAEHDER